MSDLQKYSNRYSERLLSDLEKYKKLSVIPHLTKYDGLLVTQKKINELCKNERSYGNDLQLALLITGGIIIGGFGCYMIGILGKTWYNSFRKKVIKKISKHIFYNFRLNDGTTFKLKFSTKALVEDVINKLASLTNVSDMKLIYNKIVMKDYNCLEYYGTDIITILPSLDKFDEFKRNILTIK